MPGFEILYEEGPVFVLNKPNGVLTQAPPNIDSLEVRLRNYLLQKETQPEGAIYLGIVHRLDRPVSGAVLLTRTSRAARKLSAQFEKRRVRKIYWACLDGIVEPAEGIWKDYLRKIPNQPHAEVVPPDHPDAQLAKLSYRRLSIGEGKSFVEIELHTGRMHQIRAQAAARFLPVWGDTQYGSPRLLGGLQPDYRQQPIALHARYLECLHPLSREPISITAPLPRVWEELNLPQTSEWPVYETGAG